MMNALQEENDRLKVDVAMLEGQLQKRIEETVKLRSLVFELRATLVEACDWNWLDHQSWALGLDPTGGVSSRVCKQIYTALHRKV